MSKSVSSAESKRLAATYQMKSSQRQHVLDIPDTYIGSIEPNDTQSWVFDAVTSQMAWRDIQFIPGLYKLFDEAIVNCRDHVIRMIQANTEDKKLVSHIRNNMKIINNQKRIDFRHILTTSCEQLFDNIGFEPNSAYI
jgi:DNA gyrase/topoisomerase IV subunit B